jgi:hypothetical protein
VHKQLQSCFSHDKYALMNDLDFALCCLIKQLPVEEPLYAQTELQAAYKTRTGAEAAAQLLALFGRSLIRSGSKLQHLLQQPVAAAEAAPRSGGRSSRASSRGNKAETNAVDRLRLITMCLGVAFLRAGQVQQVCGLYGRLWVEAVANRNASAIDQLLLLHAQEEGSTNGLVQQQQQRYQQDMQHMKQQQQQQGTPHMQQQRLQQQQQQQPGQQQQQQNGTAAAHKQLQLPPALPQLGTGLQFAAQNVLTGLAVARAVPTAAYTAAQNAAGSNATKGIICLNVPPDTAKLSQLVGRPNASEKQQLASARTAVECMAMLQACDTVQEMPQMLLAMGEYRCGAVPVTSCCNNPYCTNMSGVSELQLVQGRAAKGKACGAGRYG